MLVKLFNLIYAWSHKFCTYYGIKLNTLDIQNTLTSFLRAEFAFPRYTGSRARRMCKRPKEDGGKSQKDWRRFGLYERGGLKVVETFNFFQYSSDGVPQSLNIL